MLVGSPAGAAALLHTVAYYPGSLTELDLSGNPGLGADAAEALASALGKPGCIIAKVGGLAVFVRVHGEGGGLQ